MRCVNRLRLTNVALTLQVVVQNLGTKMSCILQNGGCTVEPAFIDEFHHLVKNNVRVIVTFTQCKHCKQMIKVGKDSRGLTLTTLVCVGAQN